MKSKTLLCLGDSLTAGSFATSPEFSYPWQLLKMLRNREPEANWELIHAADTSSTYLGGIWQKWQMLKSYKPDCIVFQGGENDIPADPPTAITQALSSMSDKIEFDQAPRPNQLYLLTNSADKLEWIHVQSVSAGTGATVQCADTGGVITGVTAAPTAAGTGYKVGDVLPVTGGGGTGAKVRVATVVVTTGAVATFSVTPVRGGTGYTGAVGLTTTPPSKIGYGVTRGLFGTTPQSWPVAGTSVYYDAYDADHATAYVQPYWATLWDTVFSDIIASTDRQNYQPIILAGGLWWEGAAGAGHIKIAEKVAAHGYSKAVFCPYQMADGTDIWTSDYSTNNRIGPTTSVNGDFRNTAVSCDFVDASDCDVGDFLLIWRASQGTNPTTFQVSLVSDKSGNTVYFDQTADYPAAGDSATTLDKLGSTKRDFTGALTNPLVGKLAAAAMGPGGPFLSLGAGYFAATNWVTGDHPTDAGHRELALAFFRGYESVAGL